MATWASGQRVSTVTINKYLLGEEPNILSRDKILALLKQHNRISFGTENSGDKIDWLVKMDRGAREDRVDGADTSTYGQPNRDKTAQLAWGKIEYFEKVTKGEKLKNRGKPRRVNLVQQTIDSMKDDISEALVDDIFGDGTGQTNDPVLGLRKVLGLVATPTDQYPTPDTTDTYAGIRMDLGGASGGSPTSGSWPNGIFPPKYYFWTPLQANYEHAAWGGASADWANNGPTVLRRLIDNQMNLRGRRGMIDTFFVTADMFSSFKDNQEAKQRFVVTQPGKKGLISLGFSDVINYDGVEVTPDPSVPAEYGIGLNFDGMELLSMQDQLFYTDDDYWLDGKTQKFSIDFWGQLKLNPYRLCAAIPDLT